MRQPTGGRRHFERPSIPQHALVHHYAARVLEPLLSRQAPLGALPINTKEPWQTARAGHTMTVGDEHRF